MSRPVMDSASTRGVYDRQGRAWTAIHHASPDEVIGDINFKTGAVECKASDARSAVEVAMRHEVWKTLVRYVWHNATSVAGACIYFGIAARHVDRAFEEHMERAEVRALLSEGQYKWNRTKRLLKFREHAVFRTWAPMSGYTPLAALLAGEHGEWRSNDAMQGKRRAALKAILRAAWQDVDPGDKQAGRWEKTLRGAFKNFTAMTAEDRDLLAWVTQTEFAIGFQETRAAMCARRKRKVKRTLLLNGYSATTAPGGKSEAAIATYAEAARGNHNRAGKGEDTERGRRGDAERGRGGADPDEERREVREAVRAMREHADIPIRRDLPRTARELRAHLRALAERAEARRLAALCGVDAQDISISKITPSHHDHE
jgi:hypothetical protein